jgi:hypothetical protein
VSRAWRSASASESMNGYVRETRSSIANCISLPSIPIAPQNG